MTDEERQAEIARLKARLAELEASGRPGWANPVVSGPNKASEDSADPDSNRFLIVIAAVFALLLLGFLLSSFLPQSAPSPELKRAAEAARGAAEQASREADAAALSTSTAQVGEARQGNWQYTVDRDEMRDAETKHACVDAENKVSLNWPYQSQELRLCLRNSPKWGKDVFIRLPSGGQFICRSYDGCTVKVRFDTGAVQTFSAGAASDGSNDVLFIRNAARFASALKGAKTVLIEAEFYEAGVQASRFPVEGWDASRSGF